MKDPIIQVLLIEDSLPDELLVEEKLTAAQHIGWNLPCFEIEHVTRLQAALARLEQGDIDVVLSDLDLPDSRAEETVTTLREHIPQMPLVVLTGREDEALAHKTVRAGVQDYLYKDEVTGSLLARTLMYAIERQQAHARLEQRVEARTAELRQVNENLQAEIQRREKVEAALRESERRYRDLFENSRDGFVIVDAEGRFIDANRAYCEMLGYTLDELKQKADFYEITPPRWRAWEREEIWEERLLKEGYSGMYEKEYIRKDGTVFPVELQSYAFQDKEGHPKYLWGIVRDITERKRAEEVTEARLRIAASAAARSSEDLMQMTLDELEALTNSEIGFYHFLQSDQETLTLQTWSTSTLENMCKAEGQGKHYPISEAGVWVDCVHARQPIIHNDYAALPHRKGTPPGHTPIIRELVVPIIRDDVIVAILGVGNKPTDYDTSDVEVASLLADFSWEIVTRKRAEEALRESETRFRTAISHSGIIFAQTDHELRYTWISNPHPEFAPQAAIGQRDVELADNTGSRQLMQMKQHVIDMGQKLRRDIAFPVSEGQRVYDTMAEPLRDENGQIIGVATCALDITERKLAEEALQESEKRYRELLDSMSDGIAVMDTDFNIIETNRALRRDTGRGPDVLGEKCFAAFYGFSSNCPWCPAQKALRTGEEESAVVPFPAETPQRWFHLKASPIRNTRGEITHIVESARDVTAQKRTEQALREKEALLEKSQAIAKVGSWIFDLTTNQLSWSDEVYHIFGVRHRDFDPKYKAFLERVHPNDRSAVDTAFTESLQEGYDTYEIEHRIVRGDTGEIKYVHEKCEHIRNASGQVVRAIGMVQDITERKQTEEALQKALQGFQAFFDHSPRLASVFDQEGRYRMVNLATARILGKPPEEIVGKTFAELLPPEVTDTFMKRIERLVETEAPLVTDDEIRVGGEKRIFETILFPLSQDEDGTVTFGSMASDVTERERMEQALRESEERLSLALEGAELGMWDWNIQTGDLILNERWAEMLGYTLDEIEPHLRFWETLVHPDDLPRVMEALNAHLEGETPIYQTEHRLHTKTGAWIWVLDTGKVLVRDDEGNPLRAVGTHQDITERKRTERELARYAADLKRSNEELEQFAHVVSHDLQEPARMVGSYLDLLTQRYRGQLDKKADLFIDYAVDGAKRMQEMIHALLDLSRIRTHGEAFTSCDAETILERTLRVLSRAVEDADATVTYDDLPTVQADRNQLAQVFQNLIANALKFRREDVPPRVHVSAQREDGMWRFAVTDNGIGIDPAYADRIFQIFQRLHTREEYPGTGIGLALCQKIIERHGGRIWVESEPGQGSTFYFTLPTLK